MVKPRDECPACATGLLYPSDGTSMCWECETCGLTFDVSDPDIRREPDSDGNQDFVADSIFGGRARAARVVKGATQMEIAAQVDCHWSVIAAIENGEISPRLRTVLRLARAVGVDPPRLVSSLPSRLTDPPPVDVRATGRPS